MVRANPDGSYLYLKDVARIELGAQNYNIVGRLQRQARGDRGYLSVAGTNAVQAAAESAS